MRSSRRPEIVKDLLLHNMKLIHRDAVPKADRGIPRGNLVIFRLGSVVPSFSIAFYSLQR